MKSKGWVLPILLCLGLLCPDSQAQLPGADPESYAIKIFRVDSSLYPFVQVYLRTFNQQMHPLVNLNERNIGVMMKGRSYDVAKQQYVVRSLRNREEAVRTVFVIDCSKTMAGEPFQAALEAAARFIDLKRPQDQVAVLAVRDTDTGFDIASSFSRDPVELGRRLADLRADGNLTRLYDTVGAAMQMCGLVSQGGTSSGDAEFIVSNSIVIFSDGNDEGSALSRSDLTNAISTLKVPIPIYSLAYTKISPEHLRNLEALSRLSFGIYYPIDAAFAAMTKSVEDIQNIIQSDYVITIRAYEPVDGARHPLKVGVEYPSNSGKMIYQDGEFEAIEPPPVERLLAHQAKIAEMLPALPDRDPYMKNPYRQGPPPAAAQP